MKGCFKIVLFLIVALGTASCTSDEQYYERLIGRTWVGDLGFGDDFGPLESGIEFNSNGYATDYQYYTNPNIPGPVYNLPVRWKVEYETLYLDYGPNYPLLEIRALDIYDGKLTGILYVDGENDGPVTLFMEE